MTQQLRPLADTAAARLVPGTRIVGVVFSFTTAAYIRPPLHGVILARHAYGCCRRARTNRSSARSAYGMPISVPVSVRSSVARASFVGEIGVFPWPFQWLDASRQKLRNGRRFSGSLTGRPSQIRGKEAKIFRYAAAFCWPGAEVGVVSCVVAGVLSADCGLFSDAAAA